MDSLDDGVGMFEIELNIVFGMQFGDWEKGRWEMGERTELGA